MFTIGLTLSTNEIKNIFKYPKKLFVGLSSQMILLPIITFVTLLFFNLPPEIKMGIIILAVCPGGATSNFISYIIKADTHLSVSLTTVNTIISLFSIPILVNLFLKYFYSTGTHITLPFLQTFLNLILIIILPITIGVFIRRKNSSKAQSIEKVSNILGISFLAIVFIIKIFGTGASSSGLTLEKSIILLPTLLIIHFLSLFTGFFNSRLFKINLESSITSGIETGLQSTGVALLIAGSILGNQIMTQPILVYATFSFVTTLAFGVIMKKVLMKEGLRKNIKLILEEN